MTFTPTPFRDDGRAGIKDWWSILLFVVLTLAMGYAFDLYVMKPREARMVAAQQAQMAVQKAAIENNEVIPVPRPVADVIADHPRVVLQNADIHATISSVRPRLDDLALKTYFTTLEDKDPVRLMVPAGTDHPIYNETGWTSDQKDIVLPGPETVWTEVKHANEDTNTVAFEWTSSQGLVFTRTFTVDDKFMVHISDKVKNGSSRAVKLWPYALISQHGLPPDRMTGIVHEGAIGYVGKEYLANSYGNWGDLVVEPETRNATTGWIGITSRYFFTGLIPDQKETMTYRTSYRASNPADPHDQARYQVDVQGQDRTLEPGAETEFGVNVFAGPKTLRLLESYEKQLGLTHFDLVVDFGWFYFLTKPFYYALVYLNDVVGNFGVAILALTFILRLAVFPLANTSFRSFAKMKKVQPQIQELQKQYIHDKKKMQEELVKLYTKEKVNPVSGCLPILAQIPIFFAMYKVINVAIEMRHAPFFGWIKDLSAPDPTSILNLYGLLPYDVHNWFHFGVWPSVLFVLIMIQVRLSPPPPDKMMKVFFSYYYPVVVCFVMAKFAAGLVIYWGFSALLSVVQQIVIMRSSGVPVHLFESIKSKKAKVKA